ncbi:MAG TPA: FAD-dependent oxidoreductase [Aromatoleum sp.]|uniref:FAD-dependent oxidoreductase n=1 Tax=Aromatoleum sp. TaxID=2307007 RepID=UPI002B48C960|nr:FAD-dependent oxidoreductase [Aromatoleum sp.]HJV25774.1 FAD-dependent oxidoreductase [Aromatoleum sp.]
MSAPLVIVGTGMAGYGLLRSLRHIDTRQPVWIAAADDGAAYAKFELATALAQRREAAQLVVATAEQMAYRFEATIQPHCRVVGIDRERRVLRIETSGHANDEQAYSRLVLATGAEALRPSAMRGGATDRILTVSSLAEYTYLRSELAGRKRVVVLGGGLPGCELAGNLLRGGCEVMLLEPQNRLLHDSFPTLCAGRIEEDLRSAGVSLWIEDGIHRIEQRGYDLEITTLSGARLVAEVVVAALGSRPRSTLAREAGLDVTSAVVVDGRMRSSDEHIFAVGECAQTANRVFTHVDDIEESVHVLAGVLTGGANRMLRWHPRSRRLQTGYGEAVICEPPRGLDGEWHECATGRGVRALFHDRSGKLRGFALVGATTDDTHRLLSHVGHWWSG